MLSEQTETKLEIKLKHQTLYIGIDNGVSGAWSAIDDKSNIVAWGPMPVQKYRSRNEVDIQTLWHDIHASLGEHESIIYTLEEPGGSKSAKAASSMSGSFHAIRAMLTLNNVRWHRITPKAWQKVMFPGCKAGDTKPRALELARRLWPNERFLATSRCRVPSPDAIDATLIAEYSRVHIEVNW